MSGLAVEVTEAAVSVGHRRVWNAVGFEIARGEFAAVLGPNGSGKSTLLEAMLGRIALDEGRITVLGEPAGAALRRIGYLPQRRSFDPSIRIRGVDLVRLGLDGHRWGIPLPAGLLPALRRRRPSPTGGAEGAAGGRTAPEEGPAARVDEAIDMVGASAYSRRPVGELSGGEQQRLLIAQALVRRPELLMLDEPLDSLDLPNQIAVSQLIADIASATGVTVVMVAHDVNPILPFLDRVVYLAGGTGLAGRPEEVITGETLSRLYGTPIEVLASSHGPVVVVGQPDPPAHHSDRHGRPFGRR